MVDIKWIKLSSELFTNRKIMMIRKERRGDKYVLFWIFLLTLAGRLNSDGALMITENMPYTVKTLARESGFSEKCVGEAMEIFIEYDMIFISEGSYVIKNWIRHQNAEGLFEIREKNRLRVAKYREKQREALAAQPSKTREELKRKEREQKYIRAMSEEEVETAFQLALQRSFPNEKKT